MRKFEIRFFVRKFATAYNSKFEINILQAGQALVTLLVFASIAMVTTAAAVIVTLINSQTTDRFAEGQVAHTIAEAGIENGLLKLLRDPTYTGETLPVGTNGTAVVTVSGGSVKTMTSEATKGNVRRKIQVVVTVTNNKHVITSWSEVD